jgi:hypothetical protein
MSQAIIAINGRHIPGPRPGDFGAEIEFCLGEAKEKHVVNKPAVVSIAKGLPHGPIEMAKIEKPSVFLRSC